MLYIRHGWQKREFRKERTCLFTEKTTGACPGWVIDHILALKLGGADLPANMQWQTVEEAKGEGQVGMTDVPTIEQKMGIDRHAIMLSLKINGREIGLWDRNFQESVSICTFRQ